MVRDNFRGGVSGKGMVMLLVIIAITLLVPNMDAQVELRGCIVSRQKDEYIAGCSNRSLQELPQDLPSSITDLNFGSNNLTVLDQFLTDDCGDVDTRFRDSGRTSSQWCSRFPNMMFLNLSYNHIENISSHFFSGMTRILALGLSHNKLKDIPPRIFSGNTFLYYIDFSGNEIEFIRPGVFENLHNLQVLLIGDNRIEYLDRETFKGLVSLRTLWLNNNLISSLHYDLFEDLKNLRAFRVDHNRLKHISNEILKQLPNLNAFKASHNRITFLSPYMFSNNPNLKTVNFSHNLLKKLSKYTFLNLIKMTIVNFSFNYIESLYLSYIPVLLHSNDEIKVLDMTKEICVDDVEVENPCFTSYDNFLKGNDIFHTINFSYNNVTNIKFSNSKVAHLLEVANISLAGNFGLEIKSHLIKKERFIISLNLDGTNLNWKNLTFVNEVLELKNLKTLSIIDCGACDYYTRDLLTSIFNPHKRVSIICDGTIQHAEPFSDTMPADAIESYGYSGEKVIPADSGNTTGDFEDYFHNSNYSCNLECECYANITLKLKNVDSSLLNFSCDYIMDCSYFSLATLPDMKYSFSCVLFSHNDVEGVGDEFFQDSFHTKMLDLSYNRLNNLSGQVFQPLASLNVLLLDHNNLSSLSPGLFNRLAQLVFLTLHGNKISSYDAHVFAESPRIHFISVDFADLGTLHDTTFLNLLELKLILVREISRNATAHKTVITTAFLRNVCGVKKLSLAGFDLSAHFNGTRLCSKSVQFLELRDNYLPVLAEYSFRSLNELIMIELPGNHIQIIERDTFKNLTNVIFIDLSYNSIDFLHNFVFTDVEQLTHLNVSHNKITCVSPTLFAKLSMLVTVDFSYNNIGWMDYSTLSLLYSLHYLFLNDNNITSINQFSSLRTYSRNCVQVGSSDSPVELNINITKSLLVSRNKGHVHIINISNNAIEVLDNTTFFNMPLVFHIIASHNRIHQIHNDTFKKNVEINKLELNNNILVSINGSIFKNLTRLQSLLLYMNYIEFIEHGAFHDLAALKVLILSHNRLKTFDTATLPEGSVLTFLSLRNNSIILGNSSFQELTSLGTFYLSGNPLTNVVTDNFLNMTLVHHLLLDSTNIHEFYTGTFNNLPSLRILSMGNSCIHSLSTLHFQSVRNLMILDMRSPRADGCMPGTDNLLSWKNITLINHLFETPYLQYLVLIGHDICNTLLWNQIIDNLFLSETWKIVICSEKTELPTIILTPDGLVLTRLEPIEW